MSEISNFLKSVSDSTITKLPIIPNPNRLLLYIEDICLSCNEPEEISKLVTAYSNLLKNSKFNTNNTQEPDSKISADSLL